MANLGYIQVTRQCNQRCRFCSNPPVEAQRSLEQAQALVDDLKSKGYHGVILTGGEPTLAPFLPQLLTYCRQVGLPARVISNGTRLADPAALDQLLEAGLSHLHLSLHSHQAEVHDELTQNRGSHQALVQTLSLIGARQPRLRVDINTVLAVPNADHLHLLARWVIERFPFVRHFVFNGLDPYSERLRRHPELIPPLYASECSLRRAACDIERSGRTLRIERVPLCYLADFEHCSTETRKIVKAEERTTHFLDQRGAVRQPPPSFVHRHYPCCAVCSLQAICAGLTPASPGYDPEELAPQFVALQPIRERILKRKRGKQGHQGR